MPTKSTARSAGDHLTFGDNIVVRIEQITPARAKELLGGNTHNRKLRQSAIEDLSEAIVLGDWRFNGDAIRVGEDDRLLDGQHRLSACIESGEPIVALVVYGLPSDTQETIDLGRKRSVSDALTMAGYSSAAILGGGLSLLNSWMRGGTLTRLDSRGRLTPKSALRMLEEHPGFTDFTVYGQRSQLVRMAGPSVWCAATFILHHVDAELSGEFVDGIATGASLLPGDPRLTLRERLLDARSARRDVGRLSQAAQAWLILRAWVAFQERQDMQRFVLPPTLGPAASWPDLPGDKLRKSLEGAS